MRPYLVANVKDMFEIVAHAVMLCGQECGVEDDTEGDASLKEHVVNDPEQKVLEAQPQIVVEAVASATRTIPVTSSGFCKKKKKVKLD